MQLCEYENEQTLETLVAASRLYGKFDCPVARQKVSLSASAHDCGTGIEKRKQEKTRENKRKQEKTRENI